MVLLDLRGKEQMWGEAVPSGLLWLCACSKIYAFN